MRYEVMNIEEKNNLQLIKSKGFTITKDVMGTYFDKGNKKFSIIQIGDIYNCYLNERETEHSSYKLKNSYVSQIQLNQCLKWILNNM